MNATSKKPRTPTCWFFFSDQAYDGEVSVRIGRGAAVAVPKAVAMAGALMPRGSGRHSRTRAVLTSISACRLATYVLLSRHPVPTRLLNGRDARPTFPAGPYGSSGRPQAVYTGGLRLAYDRLWRDHRAGYVVGASPAFLVLVAGGVGMVSPYDLASAEL